MARRRFSLKSLLALLVAVAAGVGAWAIAQDRTRQPPLALFTTLPLYWPEAADVGDLLNSRQPPHWARTAIERRRDLKPVDVLTPDSLTPFEDLLIAQPRALAPAENVALDAWVRAGGHLLLFADPMLTAHSRFAIGDKRRPQDVVLLSPILAHWGLVLEYDPEQPAGERSAALLGSQMPVDLPGRFADAPNPAEAAADCTMLAQGLAAKCDVGRGGALIVADAALLDPDGDDTAAREAVLFRLMAEAYGRD